MRTRLVMVTTALLAFGCMTFAANKSWVGVVSDSGCGLKHSAESDQAAACVAKCVRGGGKYVLSARGKVYQLEPQDKFADFAGKRVKVTGTMSGETITASDVAPAPAKSKMKKAKSSTGM